MGEPLDTFLPVPMKYMCRTQPNVFGNFPNHFSYVYYHITFFGHPIVTHTLSIVYLLKKGYFETQKPQLNY